MLTYKNATLVLTIFLVLAGGHVYAQAPTDGFYIDHVYQNPDDKGNPVNVLNIIGVSLALAVVLSLAAYIYWRQVNKLREENKIQKEGIQKEGIQKEGIQKEG